MNFKKWQNDISFCQTKQNFSFLRLNKINIFPPQHERNEMHDVNKCCVDVVYL